MIYDLPNNRLVVNWPEPKAPGNFNTVPDNNDVWNRQMSEYENALDAYNNRPSVKCSDETPKLWAHRNGEEIPEGDYNVKYEYKLSDDHDWEPMPEKHWNKVNPDNRRQLAYPVTKEPGEKVHTLGRLISDSMISNRVHSIPDVSSDLLEKIKTDSYYPNSIPVYTFRNMLRLLALNISEAEPAMYRTFELLEAKKSAVRLNTRNDLWENKEALGKYIARLKELLSPVPELPNLAASTANVSKEDVRGEEDIADLKKPFQSPTLEGQQRLKFSIVEILGNISLAYHRGKASMSQLASKPRDHYGEGLIELAKEIERQKEVIAEQDQQLAKRSERIEGLQLDNMQLNNINGKMELEIERLRKQNDLLATFDEKNSVVIVNLQSKLSLLQSREGLFAEWASNGGWQWLCNDKIWKSMKGKWATTADLFKQFLNETGAGEKGGE
jgi:hypothetical protein